MYEVAHSYKTDLSTTDLLRELTIIPGGKPHHSLSQGFVKYDHRICVGKGAYLRLTFLSLTSISLGVHSEQQGTCRRIKRLFYGII